MNRSHEENDIVAMVWRTIQRLGQQKMYRSAAAAHDSCIDC